MMGFLGSPRRVLIVIHDLIVTALALLVTLYIRFADGENGGLPPHYSWLVVILPCFIVYAGIVYWIFNLYIGKWRFASLPDLWNILRAVTVLAVSLLVLDYILLYPTLYGTYFFGKVTIALYWLLQVAFLGGPRLSYRLFRHSRTQQHARRSDAVPTLVVGVAADAEVLIRAVESGAVKKIR
ncbi:MAG TPA: capsular biosynthesis protein, partial [Xanthobacteraceae bacterium]|nr:capsular biosynthesis protein [Xanthobacteraceae bacterium]